MREDLIVARRERARLESFAVRQETGARSEYRVASNTGYSYRVVLRSLTERVNSCDCPDFQSNLLGIRGSAPPRDRPGSESRPPRGRDRDRGPQLLLLARLGAVSVLSAPGCARSRKENVLDVVLARLLAGDRLERKDLVALGHGGLLEDVPERGAPRGEIG